MLLESVQNAHYHFNSQPHKEADSNDFRFYPYICHFNSQPHKEADKLSTVIRVAVPTISTHSLTRRLTGLKRRRASVWIFQLTASQGG